MARIAAGGNARLTDPWSVNRCRNQRFQVVIASPASGGAATAESTATPAKAAAPAESASTETASARPAAAGPARPPAAAAAHSVDERDDESDQPADDREREHARGQPDDGAYDPSGNSGPDDPTEKAPEDCIGHDERDEQQEYRLEIDRAMYAVDDHSRPRRRQVFSLDQFHERAGSGDDAAVEVVRLEVRRDDFGYHALCDGVGYRAFKAAADFDTQLPVGGGLFGRRARGPASGGRAGEQDAGGDEAEPAFEHQRDYCFAGAPGLPKSTVGVFEIAFSSSTLKLGLTW